VLVLLTDVVKLAVSVVLVLNLVAHLISVLIEHAVVLAEFVGNVLVHLVQVGPSFLGLTVARLLERLAAVEPVSFVTDHAVVLVSSVLVLFGVLLGGVVLNVLMVDLCLSVCKDVVRLFLLASL